MMIKKSKQNVTLAGPATYQIKVPGELDESWADWVGTMTITVGSKVDDHPVTTLTVTVDQVALQGLLRSLYYLGLPVSIVCVEGN
jgi:hypothetical protein